MRLNAHVKSFVEMGGKSDFALVGDAQMDELCHGALKVRLVGEHGELCFVIDAIPNDNILFAGGLRSAD